MTRERRRHRISTDGLALTTVDEHGTVTTGEDEGHNRPVAVGEGEVCGNEAELDTELGGVTVGVGAWRDGLGVGSQSASPAVSVCSRSRVQH